MEMKYTVILSHSRGSTTYAWNYMTASTSGQVEATSAYSHLPTLHNLCFTERQVTFFDFINKDLQTY